MSWRGGRYLYLGVTGNETQFREKPPPAKLKKREKTPSVHVQAVRSLDCKICEIASSKYSAYRTWRRRKEDPGTTGVLEDRRITDTMIHLVILGLTFANIGLYSNWSGSGLSARSNVSIKRFLLTKARAALENGSWVAKI